MIMIMITTTRIAVTIPEISHMSLLSLSSFDAGSSVMSLTPSSRPVSTLSPSHDGTDDAALHHQSRWADGTRRHSRETDGPAPSPTPVSLERLNTRPLSETRSSNGEYLSYYRQNFVMIASGADPAGDRAGHVRTNQQHGRTTHASSTRRRSVFFLAWRCFDSNRA